MNHTPEQLMEMSDGELERLLHTKLGRGAGMIPAYCESWAATGPLIESCRADLNFLGGNLEVLIPAYVGHKDEDRDFKIILVVGSANKPLRAVVECLILVLQEGEG